MRLSHFLRPPVPTPDQVRGRLSAENALTGAAAGVVLDGMAAVRASLAQ